MNESTLEQVPGMRTFIEALRRSLPDTRDPRGRIHDLTFTVVATVVATMCNCQTLSSIHRFMHDWLPWLCEVTGFHVPLCVSRAHLPRLLDGIDRAALSALARECFTEATVAHWVAIDGKALRGSSGDGDRQAVVIAVDHKTKLELARTPQIGLKTSEIPVLRELLAMTGLDRAKVSMDAMHCNPETLIQIARAGGTYLAQIKGNQPELFAQCAQRAVQEPPLAKHAQCDKGHGRITLRTSKLFALRAGAMDKRWAPTKPTYLVEVLRQVYKPKSGKATNETSYYMTNSTSPELPAVHLKELQTAVRQHWSVESNNWVRDVTMGEDSVKIKAPNQGQVMGEVRSISLTLLRKTGAENLQALMEQFSRAPAKLAGWLKTLKFL